MSKHASGWNDDDGYAAPSETLPGERRAASSGRGPTPQRLALGAPEARSSQPMSAAEGLSRSHTAAVALARPTLITITAYITIASLLEIVLQALPLRIHLASWRYSIVGTIVPLLLVPMLALAMTTWLSLQSRRAWWQRVLSIALLFGSVVCLLVIPFYLLDAVQLRPTLPSALRGGFLAASIARTVATLLFAATAQALASRALWKASRALTTSVQGDWNK